MAEKYTLPELPYDYAALEPHISAKIMELHHDKHHAAYVAGANAALEQLEEARENGAYGNVSKLSKDLAFNLGTTPTTPSSGTTCPPRAATSPPASWQQQSTSSSAPSTSSVSTSPMLH